MIVARMHCGTLMFQSDAGTSVLVEKGSLVVIPEGALETTAKYTFARKLVLYAAPEYRLDRCRLVMHVRGASLMMLSPLEQLALVVDG